jgi:tryptophan 7-halogenase
MDDDRAAATLSDYLRRTAPELDIDALSFRRLAFRSGHRERFWERNCLAVGLSGGFLEPLEASAIVTIELAVEALLAGWPTRATMAIHAARFNETFRYRWDRIVEFLKLHYVLSQRNEHYWVANRDPASIPARLTDLLQLWREQPPSAADFAHVDEVFPAASYQYVLYGMGFLAPAASAFAGGDKAAAANLARQTEQRARTLAASLPANRTYLDALHGAPMLKEVS